MTLLYVLHVFALMTQSYAASVVAEDIRSTSPVVSIFEASLLTCCRRLFLSNFWRCHPGCRYPRLWAGVAQFPREWVEYL
jgi:hypothetical protein